VFDCTCNTQNSLLLNQHNGDDAPQDFTPLLNERQFYSSVCINLHIFLDTKLEDNTYWENGDSLR